MVEFLFSVFLGTILGLLFFVSARHYAHKEYETAWLWMIILSVVTLALGIIQFLAPYIFWAWTALVVSVITIRKITYHRRNVNRRPYAQRYGNWLIYFWLIWAGIFTLRMLF